MADGIVATKMHCKPGVYILTNSEKMKAYWRRKKGLVDNG